MVSNNSMESEGSLEPLEAQRNPSPNLGSKRSLTWSSCHRAGIPRLPRKKGWDPEAGDFYLSCSSAPRNRMRGSIEYSQPSHIDYHLISYLDERVNKQEREGVVNRLNIGCTV